VKKWATIDASGDERKKENLRVVKGTQKNADGHREFIEDIEGLFNDLYPAWKNRFLSEPTE
jgi:hypothetical protein